MIFGLSEGAKLEGNLVTISLYGNMSICVSGATDAPVTLNISSAKGRALLALLATSPDLSRSRAWLREILWSDRAKPQASASLRQELSNLGRVHPALKSLFQNTRQQIALKSDQVVLSEPDTRGPNTTFLEGLEVADPAFSDWVKAERRARAGTQPLAAPSIPNAHAEEPRLVTFKTSAQTADKNAFMENALSHYIGHSLNEHVLINVVDPSAAREVPDATWIEIQAISRSDTMFSVRVSVRHGPRKMLVWSDVRTIGGDDPLDVTRSGILPFCNNAVQGVLDALCLRREHSEESVDAGLLGHMGARRIFAINSDDLSLADRILVQATESHQRGLFCAWRALIRSIQLIERHPGDAELRRHEMNQLCYRALELEPKNATVLSLVANVRLEQGDNIAACVELAEQSVRLNPSNPLAWDCLSMARLYSNDHEGAHVLAMKAQEVSEGTPHAFWWYMGRAVTATSAGLLDEAILFAELCESQSPDFRPPKRYLAALYSAKGWEEKTHAKLQDIKQSEPDFDPLQLAEDPAYPCSPLRKRGLFDYQMLRALR